MDVYVEVGARRVFAGAVDWPGWCRSGKDESSALQALVAHAPRYAQVLEGRRLSFRPPGSTEELRVVERLAGGATTDFGAPEGVPTVDHAPLNGRELGRQRKILAACWDSFDRAVEGAQGVELRTGPRGGGRELDAIVRHVLDAEGAYLRRLAPRPPKLEGMQPHAAAGALRAAVLETLERAATEGIPEQGPRGGKLWRPRYFVRRAAWHVLDHAWEIEDRAVA